MLGMHRSGTSVATRLMNLLGVYRGPTSICWALGPIIPENFMFADAPHRAHDILDDVRAGERTPQFRGSPASLR